MFRGGPFCPIFPCRPGPLSIDIMIANGVWSVLTRRKTTGCNDVANVHISDSSHDRPSEPQAPSNRGLVSTSTFLTRTPTIFLSFSLSSSSDAYFTPGGFFSSSFSSNPTFSLASNDLMKITRPEGTNLLLRALSRRRVSILNYRRTHRSLSLTLSGFCLRLYFSFSMVIFRPGIQESRELRWIFSRSNEMAWGRNIRFLSPIIWLFLLGKCCLTLVMNLLEISGKKKVEFSPIDENFPWIRKHWLSVWMDICLGTVDTTFYSSRFIFAEQYVASKKTWKVFRACWNLRGRKRAS